ncbi:MAG TPA: WXG100 family type VII secretion target [Streptosporangiaceae bacterium]|nr:WXG100 family type VII secretion target [Streptosporangiaceae bacterium]
MADQSQVDRAAMAQAAQRLEDAASTTRSIRTQLQSHKADLLSNWEGNAARAFGTVFEQFDADFQKVLSTMEEMHGKLVQTRITYERTEEEQQATVNRVAGLLNNG